ncbi:MAG: GTP-binding protein, partial [Thermoanaerobaculia bacterium]
ILKEAIIRELNIEKDEIEEEKFPKIAILGKPNAGKSSLINKLAGKERAIVSKIPGTTRDPVEVLVKYYGKKYIFIDTAGEKREAKIKGEQEFLSVIKGRKALKEADIALFLLDASAPITNQDREIGFEIEKSYKGFIFLGNKVDLISQEEREVFKENLYSAFPYFDYVPVLFISALKGYNLQKIWKYIKEIQESLNYRIPTGVLNRTFREFIKNYPQRDRKFYFITQAEVNPPTFVLVGNKLDKPKESFLRFLQTKIRDIYPFKGVPIRILLKKR